MSNRWRPACRRTTACIGVAAGAFTFSCTSDVPYASSLDESAILSPEIAALGSTLGSTLPYNQLYPIRIPTYDGSGQVVHPDFAASSAASFRYPRHLAITPYAFSQTRLENPSIFVGGLITWGLETGTPNPIATPREGYLSDPDLVYVPETSELWLYYRQVTTSNLIYLVRSRDGIRWGSPVQVAVAPSHKIISPAVVHRSPNDWWMWSVNGGTRGCWGASTSVELRRSTDGRHWGTPRTVNLRQSGFYPWHIDVQWIAARKEFWAMYNVKVAGNCNTPAVFLATSTDGINWTPRKQPLLAKGSFPPFADIVYRATFSYVPASDDIVVWYSGARYNGHEYVWSAAVQRRRRADVFRASLIAYDRSPLLVPAPAELKEWP
ncbi:MAG: hypothetical protein ABI703_05250 [Gemmatimonadales bacterium]